MPPRHLIELFFGCALVFGVLMTLPIGGADMPVVISIYNAFTGLAVGLEGFVLQNPALMIAGMVVGAAGTVVDAADGESDEPFGQQCAVHEFRDGRQAQAGRHQGQPQADRGGRRRHRHALRQPVIIVPGYGLAVAQGQQKLYEFVKLLQAAAST